MPLPDRRPVRPAAEKTSDFTGAPSGLRSGYGLSRRIEPGVALRGHGVQSIVRSAARSAGLVLPECARPAQRLPSATGSQRCMGFPGHRRDHPHQRRYDPRSPSRASRRQGALHQGDRGGAARRSDRPRRALREGHADAAACRPCNRGRAAARGCARRIHQLEGAKPA